MQTDGQERDRTRFLILGATGTIGRAVSRRLAGPGRRLDLHGGHDQAALIELMTICRGLGAEAVGFLQKFTSTPDFLTALPPELEPDVLVHCFGPWWRGSLAETSADQWAWLTDANLALAGALVSRFAPGMASRGFGRIVLFGATANDRIQSYTTIAAYAASKIGLGVIAKSAAREFGARGVAVNVVCPGYVEGSPDLSVADLARAPGGQFQSVEAVTNFVEFLSTSKTLAVNGAIVSCSNGL